jgi:hypothetical protein
MIKIVEETTQSKALHEINLIGSDIYTDATGVQYLYLCKEKGVIEEDTIYNFIAINSMSLVKMRRTVRLKVTGRKLIQMTLGK